MKIQFSRNIWFLGFVSLFEDASSELLYPILPLYLASIGYGAPAIGLLEGFAAALAGLTKGYFGQWSDRVGKRAPFIRVGYSLSSLVGPLLPLFQSFGWVFGLRMTDRLGSGLRGAARDALLSDDALPGQKGAVFGFHRAMDTVGAVIGPCVALLWLSIHPKNYVQLFYIAAIPGALTILSTLLVRDKKKATHIPTSRPGPFSFFRFWHASTPHYRSAVRGLVVFALINSSDMFLMLRAKQVGFGSAGVVGCFILYNIVHALGSYPFGRISDRWGAKNTVLLGLVVFALCYAGLGFATQHWMLWVLFALYGVFASATDGITSAWLAHLEPTKPGSALGLFGTLQSMAAFFASLVAGLVWQAFGSQAMLVCTGVAALGCALYLFAKAPDHVANSQAI